MITPIHFLLALNAKQLTTRLKIMALYKLIHEVSVMSIKPGPKPKAESTGKTDQRRSVTPENKSKHPSLDTHKHKPGK
jgi:hypothetical protein